MIYIPCFNVLTLPDVSCYFRLDYLNGMSDQPVKAGDKVLFLMLKEQREGGEIEAEDIYPIAVRGVVESIENQWALVHTTNRVNLDSVQVEGKSFRLEMRMRPDLNDLDPDEKEERFQKMRSAMLQTFQGTQWMQGDRSYMQRWKNMNEIVTFTSALLQISNEEKYAILEEDSVAKRTELMEKAFYESLELYKVSSEAQNAQQQSNEKLYREQALRRQIDFLQKELDDLHPENVTDVRKFEQKIQESGMNETARAEAEKVLNRMKQEGQESHEYGMLYDYLDFVTSLKWKKEEPSQIDLKAAREVLDEDHFGLKKTKERIIQQIARKHLLPKAMEKAGIREEDFTISDEGLRALISDYTMEAGVRGLKNRLDASCRAAAVRIVSGSCSRVSVEPKDLRDILEMSPIRHDHILETKNPGIVTGLAWTQAGGEILFIETLFTKGSGKITVTGQLGDVMKESVQIAISLVKAMFPEKEELFEQNDLHIHVPAGAVPKDGPSAGITLTTALASLVTGKPVHPEIAMTGEVSLRGVVMPIGGLPEKLMAAQRAGVKRVLIPEENTDDLRDVAEEVKQELEMIPVHQVRDVLKLVGIWEDEEIAD